METPTVTSAPVDPSGGAEEPADEQPGGQVQLAVVDHEGIQVITEFVDAWKAGDTAGMGEASASDLPDAQLQWLVDLGIPDGEPYECRPWEDDDGLVAQCYVEIPDHGQYEQETHYILARPQDDGTWKVTWAAVVAQ